MVIPSRWKFWVPVAVMATVLAIFWKKLLSVAIFVVAFVCATTSYFFNLNLADLPLFKHETQIWHVQIAGQDLWIPSNYYVRNVYEPKADDIWLHALYPDLSPLNMTTTKLYSLHEQDKYVTILASIQRKPMTMSEWVNRMINFYSTDDDRGQQYGLEYMTQKPGTIKDWGELWIEKNDYGQGLSFIKCDKDGSVQFPLCNDNFKYKNLIFKVSYHRPLLSHWKQIRTLTIKLFDGFAIKPSGNIPIRDGKVSFNSSFKPGGINVTQL